MNTGSYVVVIMDRSQINKNTVYQVVNKDVRENIDIYVYIYINMIDRGDSMSMGWKYFDYVILRINLA